MSLVHNVIHLFAPLTANCRDFKTQWDRSLSAEPRRMGGCWTGEWISAATGHRGPLHCVMDAADAGTWRMYFRAEYSKVFRACYSTQFRVTEQSGQWVFNGGSNLGALAGGAYEYNGSATLQELTCSYKSARDHGEFRLARVRT